MATKKASNDKRFEEMMGELEAIVGRIESGNLGLEDALAAFEQGIALVRLLNDKLNLAEKRVELLSRDAEGVLRLQPLNDEKEDPSS
jgi:exodeoxyribonuclease VII small subunit